MIAAYTGELESITTETKNWTGQNGRLNQVTSGRACLAVSHAFFNNNCLQSQVTSLAPSINLHHSIQFPCDIQIVRTLLSVCFLKVPVNHKTVVSKVEHLSKRERRQKVDFDWTVDALSTRGFCKIDIIRHVKVVNIQPLKQIQTNHQLYLRPERRSRDFI